VTMANRLAGGIPAPGELGEVVALHGRWYARHWKFGVYFEALVARDLGGFLVEFDAARDGFWIEPDDGGTVAGSISIVGPRASNAPARLRWFIVDERMQGRGLGRKLMRSAMQFCREVGHQHVTLTTFAGLDAARALYEAHGFRLTDEHVDRSWGVPVTEQRFDWTAH
jgi:GNAT superfamily N-acetyltransferase